MIVCECGAKLIYLYNVKLNLENGQFVVECLNCRYNHLLKIVSAGDRLIFTKDNGD